jgi:quercetin dioxygenase-like cupin family protein
MTEPTTPIYDVEKLEILAQTPELRMIMVTLAEGQETPWHWHSVAREFYFGLDGMTAVEMRAPCERIELALGQTCIVPPKRAHRTVTKDGGSGQPATAPENVRGESIASALSCVRNG